MTHFRILVKTSCVRDGFYKVKVQTLCCQMTHLFCDLHIVEFFSSVDTLRCQAEDEPLDTNVVPPDPTLQTLM